MPLRHCILGPDHELIPCDLMTWAKWLEENQGNRHVGKTDVGDLWVSTVFLGLDHQFGNGPPLVFETMVFEKEGGKVNWSEKEMYRYSTWDDAEAGHKAVVKRLRARLKEKEVG